MGIGASVLLIAAGAVMAFAVNVTGHGFNIHTIGLILMIVEAIGLLTALTIGGMGSWGGVRRTTVVDDGYADPAAGRRVVRDTYR
ncbi:MAG TPA: hypothetical protein VFW24_18025 [Acidimicrobiales bacterium]|nr:hypothetical protein [Acidimicrobiales bacterium]